jgi:hypothetical protein
MTWLSDGDHRTITISKWMLWVWFGLDGTGIQRSVDFHWLLGPILMVAFAFLGNTCNQHISLLPVLSSRLKWLARVSAPDSLPALSPSKKADTNSLKYF